MRIEIEIPKEFEKHFNEDKFKDSFERIMADIKHSLQNGDCLCAGRYEHETMEMLENAFENSKPAYSVDKVVEELEIDSSVKLYGSGNSDNYLIPVKKAIEIVKQGGVSDDFCEWTQSGDMAISPHTFSKYKIKQCDGLYALSTCPYCGKKINGVE